MRPIVTIALAATLAALPPASQALGTNEKGCLVGGAAGGLAGHALGNHGVLGAALGCGAGIVVNKDRVKRKDAQAAEAKRRHAAAKRRQVARAETNRDEAVSRRP